MSSLTWEREPCNCCHWEKERVFLGVHIDENFSSFFISKKEQIYLLVSGQVG